MHVPSEWLDSQLEAGIISDSFPGRRAADILLEVSDSNQYIYKKKKGLCTIMPALMPAEKKYDFSFVFIQG